MWLDVVAYSFPIAFLPPLLDEEGYSSIIIGLLMSSLWWASILTTLLITIFSGLYPVKDPSITHRSIRQLKIIILCLFIQFLTHLLVAFYPTFYIFFIYRIIAGISSGFSWVYILAASTDIKNIDPKHKSGVMTFLMGMSGVGEISGPPLGAFLYAYLSLSLSYIIMSLIFIAVALPLIITTILYSKSSSSDTSPNSLSDPTQSSTEVSTIRDPIIFGASLTTFGSGLLRSAIDIILPLFMDYQLSSSTTEIGVMFLIFSVIDTASCILIICFSSYLTTQKRIQTVIVIFSIAMSISGSLLLLPRTYNDLLITVIIFGSTFGATGLPSNIIAMRCTEINGNSESAMAILNLLWYGGFAVGVFAGGISPAYDAFYQQITLIILSFCLLITITIYLILSKKIMPPI